MFLAFQKASEASVPCIEISSRMNRFIPFFLLFWGLLSCMSCGGNELKLLNEVNLFAPQWQEVSQQYAFVKRNLSNALPQYRAHLSEIKPKIEKADFSRKSELLSLQNRFTDMIDEAESLENVYLAQYNELKTTVQRFNNWQTRLMQNKEGGQNAQEAFREYKSNFRKVKREASELQKNVIQNIDQHNSLMGSFSRLLDGYRNYEIQVR